MNSPDDEELAQKVLLASSSCPDCSQRHICQEQGTARGCLEDGPPHANLLHPSKPDWLARLTQVNGLGLHTIQAIDQDIPPLPRYVPRMRLNAGIREYGETAALALSLREVERLAARVRESGLPAKILLGLPDDGLLVVLGFEKDTFLEKVWPLRRRRQLLAALGEIHPDVVVAWGYSVWYRHANGWVYPRVEQLYSIKRSLVTYQNLQRVGLPAIPHVYWGDRADLDRWSRWLEANPSVRTIAVDLQTADSEADWHAGLRGLAYLRGVLQRPLRALFNGVCSLPHLRELDEVWPGCSVSSFGAYFSSRVQRKAMYGLRAPWTYSPSISRQAVFELAAREFAEFLSNPGSRGHFTVAWGRSGSLSRTNERTYIPPKVRRVCMPVQLELPLVDPALQEVA